ncbi:Pentatricopeptide repeat [Parasponia andersonii]|uniref:Pentatricopeptide repeat n=1 Tax=Parasponia andersonii TaxID=3476 RepID=A0A2P5DH53_PARAD|nr:Pentatricopeptide repeat [Parasponia andersonii]
MKDALQTFLEMPKRNPVSWNALTSAYAQNGGCHCKLVGGLEFFDSMTPLYTLVRKREHYASMIAVLCRSGRFDEAEELMAQTPFGPDEIIWSSILNAC